MRYIPGSQAGASIYPHHASARSNVVLDQEVDPACFDSHRAMDNVLEAGEFSLHDVYLIHGSNANRSSRRRAAFVIRYMPASSTFVRNDGDEHRQGEVRFNMSKRPIWLLRGRDRSGNDFEVGKRDPYRVVTGTDPQG